MNNRLEYLARNERQQIIMTHEEKIEVTYIDPDKAAKLLEGNVSNRNEQHQRVVSYARMMSQGKWRFTGDAIRVDTNGRLIDGQHRLLAIIKSGATIKCVLITNMDPGVFVALDGNLPRSGANTLHVKGWNNSSACASALRYIYMYERTHALGKNEPFGGIEINLAINDLAGRYPDIEQMASRVRITSSRSGLKTHHGLLTAGWHLFRESYPQEAEDFIIKVCSGENIGKINQEWHVRSRLLSDPTIYPLEMGQLLTIAWNKQRRGDVIRVLRTANSPEQIIGAERTNDAEKEVAK